MDDGLIGTISAGLKAGGAVVIRTDTLYGIIALASHQAAVEKVYEIKHRNPAKQCIVLINDASDVPAYEQFIRDYSSTEQPTSVIVPASTEPEWLLRGGDSIAYRVVNNEVLRAVIARVGPVIAPSANPEGEPPAATIDEAKAYFGEAVALYVDGGAVPADVSASRIVQISLDGTITTVRP
jgi:L-threonylcarbamoyladenylate synthase